MATETDGDTERVSVRTYVPAYQRDAWDEEADSMDMSRAEYVRTMVQRGRREELLTEDRPEDGSDDATPGGEPVEDRIIDVLRRGEYVDWDELIAGVTEELEDRVERALDRLQERNRVRYSGRHGGYALVDDGD
ncbi:MAG: DUF5805 domain-containing protein [Haloarculaceae archaeon]